jgi:excinuclease ABC subunit B
MDFKLVSPYKPQGDQRQAIESLVRGLADREQHQVLLGVTGSGKTYTMAKVIEAAQSPFDRDGAQQNACRSALPRIQEFLPHNAVEYFVSYYDYYQPEAYVPAADLYIEKEATINDELDKLRLSATRSSSSGAMR